MKLLVTVFCSLLIPGLLQSQTIADTSAAPTQQIEILAGTQRQTSTKLPDGTRLQILAGKVALRQGNTFFYCDSLIMNPATNILEAFGRVHINDADTTQIYSNYLKYLTDVRYAYLKGNVRLTGGQGTLTTNELEYDVANNIGTYKNNGRVVTKKTVLTSREGIYYADTRDVFFKNKVELKDPAYYVKTDSMIYNTETQLARIITDTYIRDSSGRVIRTTEAVYDLKTGNAEFSQRTTIVDGEVTIIGDQIANDDAAGLAQIRGNAILRDKKNGLTILANEIFANKKTEAYMATRKPVMIIKQEKDSIYIAADTLFTARLSDRFPVIDTARKTKATTKKQAAKKDSTDRYFEGFQHVRVFSDSMQAVSDSLFYSLKDSTFRLFYDPIVWTPKNQITGDTIYLHTRNKKAHRLRVFENSFLVNQLGPDIFNQVKATRMDALFTDGTIDSVRAKGFAASVYYLQDKDSAYTGVNQTNSDIMDVYFQKGDLKKVVFRSAVKGTLWPISHKKPSEMRLPDFKWQESRRPKTRYELFE
jgi:lipopolysaccharide export system protein LptA